MFEINARYYKMETIKTIILVLALLSIILTMLWHKCLVQVDKPFQKTSIAIVGNGPVPTKHLDEIKNSNQIVYFNHCEHFKTIGNSCDYLFLRQSANLSELCYYKTPILEQLDGQVSTQNIIVFGISNESILRHQVKKIFPHASVVFEHTWDPRYSPRLRNASNKIKFADKLLTVPDSHPWGFTTGFLGVSHLLEIYETVDIYGFTFEKPPRELQGHPRELERHIINSCPRCRVHTKFM